MHVSINRAYTKIHMSEFISKWIQCRLCISIKLKYQRQFNNIHAFDCVVLFFLVQPFLLSLVFFFSFWIKFSQSLLNQKKKKYLFLHYLNKVVEKSSKMSTPSRVFLFVFFVIVVTITGIICLVVVLAVICSIINGIYRMLSRDDAVPQNINSYSQIAGPGHWTVSSKNFLWNLRKKKIL